MFKHLLIDGGEQITFAIAGVALLVGIITLIITKRGYLITAAIVAALIISFAGVRSANNHYWTTEAKHQLAARGFYVWSLNVQLQTVGVTANGCAILMELHTRDGNYYPLYTDVSSKHYEDRQLTPANLSHLCTP